MTALIINSFRLNILHKFLRQGYNIITNENENITKIIQNEYQQNKIMSLPFNLQNQIEIHQTIEKILNHFQHIDILILNNQCRQHYRTSIEEFPIEKWREIINYNLLANFSLIKILWPHMKRQYFGRIIHIANEHSVNPSEYQSACTTSHYALLGLNKALSIEGASFGITSNVICPGYSQMNISEEFNHIKTLEDLILFLCTDQARSINGQTIPWNVQ